MRGKILAVLVGLAISGTVSAGLFDKIKQNLDVVNQTLDDVNQEVGEVGLQIDDIDRQVDDVNSELDAIGDEFGAIGDKTRGIGKDLPAGGKRAGGPTTTAGIDASRFTDEAYSFDIKRIRLGESFRSLKERYPGAKMLGGDPASLLPDPTDRGLRVKMSDEADGERYVSAIYLQQDLGASTRSSCAERVQALQDKLVRKYGAETKKGSKQEDEGSSHFLVWIKAVPGSEGDSRLYARATCRNDASGSLGFALVAKGEYVREILAARRQQVVEVPAEIEADF